MEAIYVAEDVAPDAETIRDILLARPGCEVTVFADGLEVYRAVRTRPPHLLIVDLTLPSLAGLALVKLLKLSDSARAVPLVATTAIAGDEVQRRALDSGADAFLRKPLERAVLLATVEELLR